MLNNIAKWKQIQNNELLHDYVCLCTQYCVFLMALHG